MVRNVFLYDSGRWFYLEPASLELHRETIDKYVWRKIEGNSIDNYVWIKPLKPPSMDSSDEADYDDWLKDIQDSDEDEDAFIVNHLKILKDCAQSDVNVHSVLSRKHGGSHIGRSPNLKREHTAGHARIMRDYFSDTSKYPDATFRRRFRMRKELFMRIHDQLLESCEYFVQRLDAVGKPGLSSIQKMTAAMRMFTYGVAADAVDEYVQIGESTAIASFKEFASGIVNVFEFEYMRSPTEADVKKHMDENLRRGFPGMFGSLDCTHWIWKNCPYSLQGQYRDKDGNHSIILEAICTQNLKIWHSFVGIPGSNNDINVVDRSSLLVDMLKGAAQSVTYQVNGHTYDMFYLLCDGIYPDYTVFVKTIPNPEGAKRKYFAKRQEAARKDIEHCFGVLQARFAMVRNPSRWWDDGLMITVWKAAIILHNMIIEDEEDHVELTHDYLFENSAFVHMNTGRPHHPLNFSRFSNALGGIRNKNTVHQLQEDLVSHLWDVRGNQEDD